LYDARSLSSLLIIHPLSDSCSAVLIFPIFQNWAKRFLLENIDFLPVGGNFISPLRPET